MNHSSRNSRSDILAPFTVRSFRFQFPADLLTSWASEMEILILGWYILTETGSVLLLTVYGSLQYGGTLLAPVFGLAGDRLGHRNVLCGMRAIYAALAGLMTVLAALAVLNPVVVLCVAMVVGLIRPSELAIRNALVAETMPGDRLMPAMGVARITSDSARVVGALAGGGLFALLGMAPVYAVIATFYGGSLVLTLGVGAPRPAGAMARLSLWRDLREGLAYVCDTPASLAALWLAFLVNMTAFPLTLRSAAVCCEGDLPCRPKRPWLPRGKLRRRRPGRIRDHRDCRPLDPPCQDDARLHRPVVCHAAGLRACAGHPGRAHQPGAGGLRPKPLHDADGGDAAAQCRRQIPRPRHGGSACWQSMACRLACWPRGA